MSSDAAHSRRTKAALATFAGLVLFAVAWDWRDVPGDVWAYWTGERPLAQVASWHYQLDQIDVEQLNKRDVDMLVIDYAREGGKTPLTRGDITRLKTKPNGQRRQVIAYLSIGEAEEFRYYWNEAWKIEKPAWLERENCAWPKAWMVRYWDPGWRELIVAGRDAYLKRIVDVGFDGVYLDRIDIWEHTSTLHPDAKAAMIDFVVDLAAVARQWRPGFIVIAQNAEDLLEDRRYRRTVDAVAKEELFFSSTNTGARNPAANIARALGHLSRLRWHWKPVFPVEYLMTAEAIARANSEERALGLVPVFPTRALDGADPTAAVTLEHQSGTPEFIKTNCKDGSWW